MSAKVVSKIIIPVLIVLAVVCAFLFARANGERKRLVAELENRAEELASQHREQRDIAARDRERSDRTRETLESDRDSVIRAIRLVDELEKTTGGGCIDDRPD